MKVRLLKKVRKRFEIHHKPNGVIHMGHLYDYNIFELIDNQNSLYVKCAQLKSNPNYKRQYCDKIFNSEKECIDYLKSLIIVRLKEEGYKSRKDKSIIQSSKKIWYNKK